MGLKVEISGIRFRRSDGNKLPYPKQMELLGKRLSNNAVIRLRKGDNPADLDRILHGRMPSRVQVTEFGKAYAVVEELNVRRVQVNVPTIEVPGAGFRIMKNAVTVDLAANLLSAGYDISGSNTHSLLDQLRSGAGNRNTAVYLNVSDAWAIALMLTTDTREFKVPTQEQWALARKKVRARMTGGEWEWTDSTSHGKQGVSHILRSFDIGHRHFCCPELRYDHQTVRLIEVVKQ